jgi:hypothetical protein
MLLKLLAKLFDAMLDADFVLFDHVSVWPVTLFMVVVNPLASAPIFTINSPNVANQITCL